MSSFERAARLNRRTVLKAGAALSALPLAAPWVGRANAAATAVTMQFDWKFNVQFAGCFIAQEKGLYSAAGLDVTFKEWTDGVNVIDDAAAGPNVFACAEQNLIIAAQAAGKPVKAVATMFQASPYGLMSTPQGAPKTLADLEGKPVGVHVDGLKVMDLVMGVNGMKNGIPVTEIPYDKKFDRVVSGEFAAVQCYVVDEPVAVASAYGMEPSVMRLSDYGFRSTAQTIVASEATIRDNGPIVAAFLKATFDGWRAALADVPAAAGIVAEKYAVPGSKYTDVAYQTRSLMLIKDYVEMGVTPETIGRIDREAYWKAAELMQAYGIVDSLPPADSALALDHI